MGSQGYRHEATMRLVAACSLFLVTGAYAQECTVPSEKLVGIVDRAGTCIGLDKDFALKYSIPADCIAAPRPGHMWITDRCVADYSGPPSPAPNDFAGRIEQLENEVDRLRSK